ncbi:hypothetical protein [Aureimonas sp. AU4]|uniref:hypothetical protein n=1 Tax=Aureimonas sp. AU4 TaxID=1638163 RepID=UPI00078031EF|nr:hypothetical protein [Aureimonas sp. AU4]
MTVPDLASSSRASAASAVETVALTRRFGSLVALRDVSLRIALLEQGELVEIGPPAALKARLGPDAALEDVFTARLPAGSQKEGR